MIKRGNKYFFQRVAVYFAVLLWLLAATNVFWKELKEDREVTAFGEGTIATMQGNITSYGEYGVIYLSENTKEKMLKKMAEEIGINNYEITTETIGDGNDDNTFVTILCQNGKNGNVVCKIITVENRLDNNVIQAHQYVYINIVLNNSYDSMPGYKTKVEKIMKRLKINADVSTFMS